MQRKIAYVLLAMVVAGGGKRLAGDTFTWAGHSGVFSDPASWFNGVAPARSPTDTLLFGPSAATHIGTVDTPLPWVLNTLAVTANGQIDGTTGLLFAGIAPGIRFTGNPQFIINAPFSFSSNFLIDSRTYNSTLTITQPFSDVGTGSSITVARSTLVTYQSNMAPGFTGGLTLATDPLTDASPIMTWLYTPAAAGPVTLSFGSGPIKIDGGTFQVAVPPGSPSVDFTLTNPLVVTPNGGTLWIGPHGSGSSFNYSGPLTLGGSLVLQPTGYGFDATFQDQVGFTRVAGTITLDQSSPATPMIYAIISLAHPDHMSETEISGNIVDDPGPTPAYQHPLILGSYDISGVGLGISGTHNTYSTGTTIRGIVSVGANSSLGSGNVTVEWGVLTLNAPTNIAPGRKITLTPDGALALHYSGDPGPLIDPASQGILALDMSFSQPLNMATIGNGQMALGSAGNGTYDAATLRPGLDHVYRFASTVWGIDTNLTVTQSVLMDYDGIASAAQLSGVTLAAANTYSGGSVIGTRTVYATATGALGTGNVIVGTATHSYDSLSGTLYLNAPNAVAPAATITVYGSLIVGGTAGSIPNGAQPPNLFPGSILQLGDGLNHNGNTYGDNLALFLPSATLAVSAPDDSTETMGSITYAGQSTVHLSNSGNANTTLVAATLLRADHGALTLLQELPTQGPQPTLNLRVDSALALTNGMLPPYLEIQRNPLFPSDGQQRPVTEITPSFTTYTASGIAPATYTALPQDGGSGTEIVDIRVPPPDWYIVGQTTLPANTSVYALRTNASIRNPASGPVVLQIISGGIILGNAADDTLAIDPDINFGNAEAVVNVTSFSDNPAGDSSFNGVVTTLGGLTKLGGQALYLTNPNSTLAGPITVLRGSLYLAAAPVPSADPVTIYSGGLGALASLTLDRTVHFSDISLVSREINSRVGGIQAAPGATFTFNRSLTSDVLLVLNQIDGQTLDPSTFRFNAPITIHGSTEYGLAVQTNSVLQLDSTVNIDHGGAYFTGLLTGTGTLEAGGDIVFDSAPHDPYTLPNGLSPGDAPGDTATTRLITGGTVIFSGNLILDLSPTHSDCLDIQGPLSLTTDTPSGSALPPALTLNFLDAPGGQTYLLISADSIDGTFVNLSGLPDGYFLDYSHPGELLLAPTDTPSVAFPEPSSLGLLCAGGALLCLRRRCGTLKRQPR